MLRSGENNHHVHDGYGKEMALSFNVKDTDEDKDEDKSNNSIARYFDEPSAENLESESDCNIVNATTELNYDEHIKPSENVIEASYFNIFECGRNVLDKLDVTYQSASQHPKTITTSSSSYISIEENIICIHRIPKTVITVTSSTSSRLCFSIKETILGCADEKY